MNFLLRNAILNLCIQLLQFFIKFCAYFISLILKFNCFLLKHFVIYFFWLNLFQLFVYILCSQIQFIECVIPHFIYFLLRERNLNWTNFVLPFLNLLYIIIFCILIKTKICRTIFLNYSYRGVIVCWIKYSLSLLNRHFIR